MFKALLFIIGLFCVTVQAQKSSTTILPVESFKDSLQAKKRLLIDVRTADEFNAGHISQAQHIDFLQTEHFKKEAEKLDKNTPVYLYCRSGNRSGKASKVLEELGFKTIYDLKGGYLKWSLMTKSH